MTAHTKVYISMVSAAGLAAMLYASLDPSHSYDLFRLCAYFTLSMVAATLKLRLPGLTGTMSIGFVLVLVGVSELTLSETMLLACSGAAVQCLWRAKRRPEAIQVLFSVSAVAISLMLTFSCCNLVRARFHHEPIPIVLAIATCLYFLANSLLVSGVLALVRQEPLGTIWQKCYLLALPYYLVGGALAGLITASEREYGWKASLLLLPVMGLVFLFYRFYLARTDPQADAAAAPVAPLRTIEMRSA